MRHGYTHITLVCDRSGSMSSVRTDAEGAVNHFISEQKVVPGEATLLFFEFDANGADWFRTVHDGDIMTAPTYSLQPRGGTALLDATGKAITLTGEKLAALPEDERPEHVVFVVQTDGQENSSQEWKLDALRSAITEQTEKWNWNFVFLGMGPDTFAQGHSMGFQNVTRSAQSGASYAASYGNTSSVVGQLRTNSARDLKGTNVSVDESGNVVPTPAP